MGFASNPSSETCISNSVIILRYDTMGYNYINPLKCSSVRQLHLKCSMPSGLTYTFISHIRALWRSGRQCARMSDTKNVG